MQQFGKRLAHARKRLGITQEEAAHRAGMSTSNYQRIEAGQQNVTLRTIARIAAALEIQPAALFV